MATTHIAEPPPAVGAGAARPSWMLSLSAAATNLGAARHAVEASTAAARREHRKQRLLDSAPVVQPATLRGQAADRHGTIDLAIAGRPGSSTRRWPT